MDKIYRLSQHQDMNNGSDVGHSHVFSGNVDALKRIAEREHRWRLDLHHALLLDGPSTAYAGLVENLHWTHQATLENHDEHVVAYAFDGRRHGLGDCGFIIERIHLLEEE